MKQLALLLLLLCTAAAGFAQHARPPRRTLLDTLREVNLDDDLYREIGELRTSLNNCENRQRQLERDTKAAWDSVQLQQDYRMAMDYLEAGEPLQQLPGRNTADGGNYGLMLGSQEAGANPLYLVIDTLSGPETFSSRLYRKDGMLAKLYPKVFKRVSAGSVLLQPGSLLPMPRYMLLVSKLDFPACYQRDNSLAAKRELASQLLDFITATAQHYVDGDVIPGYLALEHQRYPQAGAGNLDAIIAMRRKFINRLVKTANASNTH